MQARLIKGIQKPRPEFETVGACLIMLHGISDAGANFECWYVEFLGHQEQHLEFIDAAAAHMSAYDDNPLDVSAPCRLTQLLTARNCACNSSHSCSLHAPAHFMHLRMQLLTQLLT